MFKSNSAVQIQFRLRCIWQYSQLWRQA